jgi:excisionase family DNA binding protein
LPRYAIIASMTRLFNTKETAARLRISESTVQRLFRKQQLQGVKIGRALRFTEVDISTFIERHREVVESEQQQTTILSPRTTKISFT